ncbi:hypothetical protein Pfo_005051 [Paulownia fortunei]|nr:hypothetical protein Pfo_005051 [Paulownia fortunei]
MNDLEDINAKRISNSSRIADGSICSTSGATDEYIKIGESTAVECMERFCRALVEVFVELLHIGKQRGFPGMLGSLDSMNWRWKNCPTTWEDNIQVEVDLRPLFSNLYNSSRALCYLRKKINMGYYLVDGIYPKWSTFVQIIHDPRGLKKKKYFAMKQEACKKDVERAFEVLQSQFAIVAILMSFWRKKCYLHDIMTACIIMHNMIVENEQFLARYRQIKDKKTHIALRNALIDHLWDEYTNS